MTKKEIASLACKILAVYALLQIPQYLQGLYLILSEIFEVVEFQGDYTSEFFWKLATAFAPTLLYLTAGILLWCRSNALASKMVSDEQTDRDQCRLPGREFMAIAFSIVGLVVLVRVIPQITYLLTRMGYEPPSEFRARWYAGTIAQFVGLTVQVILGAVLLVGGRALSQLVMRIRTAGLNDKDQNQT